MYEIVRAGGWLMVPILLSAVAAMAITIERLWTLREKQVLPKHIVAYVREWMTQHELEDEHLLKLHQSSPLGQILAAGLASRFASRDIVRERIEDSGRHVVHELERYLNALHTIAAITPLMGLLGTVIGMIKVFAAIMANGVGNPGSLAGGISEALITTAAGLSVAIPTLIGYRYLRGRVDGLVVKMEKEAWRFLETLPNPDSRAQRARYETQEPIKRRA